MTVSPRAFALLTAGLLIPQIFLVPLHPQGATSRVVVQVAGLHSSKGRVDIGLWKSKDGFPANGAKAFRHIVVAIADGKATTTFADLPYGEYAVAVYHDENSNGKMDTRFPGIPVEGVGSSNNPRTRFGPPSFAQCRFTVAGAEVTVPITVNYF